MRVRASMRIHIFLFNTIPKKVRLHFNKTIPFLCLATLATLTWSCGDDDVIGGDETAKNVNANNLVTCKYADRLEFPKLSNNGHSVVIVHTTNDKYDLQGVNFATEWDYKLGSQRWSCYQMHTGFGGSWGRYDYKNDPAGDGRQYPWDTDLDRDYYDATDYFYSSGFDHGHICPAADRNYSFLADKQTFYMTNMQPQYNKFNAGLWAKLEGQIRTWTNASGTEMIYVCKGATIDKEENILKRISGKLIAPKYFFCALLLKNASGYRAIGFWMLNENVDRTNERLGDYALSVDELEQKTGIDFFCNLPDNMEEDRESRCDKNAWGL